MKIIKGLFWLAVIVAAIALFTGKFGALWDAFKGVF